MDADGRGHPTDPGAFVPGPRVHRAGAPDGPLVGLTFAAKDLFDLAGLVTGAGNPDWARTHEPATHDAEAVSMLLGAGATLTGRTVTDELAFSIIGMNAHEGTPRNAAAPDRIPGGSSSGSAAAVAHGLVDFALGTDTGGSVRVPAACNGLYGIRPTHGRVSLAGVFPAAPSFDTCGWLTRELLTLQRVAEVLLGPEPRGHVPPPAVGAAELVLATDLFDAADSEVRAALAPTIGELRRHAHVVEVEALGVEGLDDADVARGLLTAHEFWAEHGAWITAVQPHLGERTARKVAGVAELADRGQREAGDLRRRVTARLDELTSRGAALVLPTMPGVAPLLTSSDDELDAYNRATMRFTALAGLAGLPQISVPAATTPTGVPVGLSLLGARHDDRHLLRLARLIRPAQPRSGQVIRPGDQAGRVRRRKSAVRPQASSAASGWWKRSENELSKAWPAAWRRSSTSSRSANAASTRSATSLGMNGSSVPKWKSTGQCTAGASSRKSPTPEP